MHRQSAKWLLFSLPILLTSQARAAEELSAQIEHFEKKIRPVLVQQCYRCHSSDAKRIRGGLRLDTRQATLKGGDSGPVLVPGNPKKSLLLQALRYEKFEMPPSKKLDVKIIADFEKWIRDGAVDPRSEQKTKVARTINIEEGKKFWAFQQPQRHSLPDVKNGEWPRRRLDWFILSKLEAQGLQPTISANRRIWIRRVTVDLTGLPPTPEEVDAFVQNQSPDAEAKVVERLLASPHYGERWARPWLDVARYAEDQAHIVGNNKSLFYPNAYLYRDWLITALNNDIPYDRFVKLQLAADVIEPKSKANLPALGYLGLGPKYYRRNSLEVKADEWEDRVDVVTRGLLGITVACARCHDHKYDPIPTEDYYALAGVFASTEMENCSLKNGKKSKKPTEAMHIVAEGKPTDLTVFLRGNVQNKGPVVQRRFLQVLSSSSPKSFTHGSGRLDLAEAIASSDNPLTARVIVNRIWAQHFGRGLVATPSNFGKLGERPTHPELLDDLAVRFIDNGWSLKWLHREILLSATYRQSAKTDESYLKIDPENRWLGRMSRRRLSVEAWRDALLATSGPTLREHGGQVDGPAEATGATSHGLQLCEPIGSQSHVGDVRFS